MKKNIVIIMVSIALRILFTFFFLNKENIYAKEEYLVYAFQVGAYTKKDNAEEFLREIPSGIIIEEDNLYKVYACIYKNIDLVNKMVVYLENKGINVYLKTLPVTKKFYNILSNYEKIVLNSSLDSIYDQVNNSILTSYIESLNND